MRMSIIMNKRFIIIYLLMFSAFSLIVSIRETGSEQERCRAYSLGDLYGLALERTEEIKIAKNQLVIAEKDEDRAFSVLAPTLSAFGNYIRYSESSFIQPKSGRDYGVKLQQQFTMNGKELILLKAARDVIKQREYDLDAVRENNLFNVAGVFYNIVNRKKRVGIFNENVNRLKSHKEAVLKKLKLEEVPKTDLLRTEAELSGAKAELVKAENELIFSRATLARMLDLPRDYELIISNGDDVLFIDGRLDDYIKTALKNRSDMKSLEMATILAQEDIDLFKSDYWPVLSVEAGYKVQETDPADFSGDPSLYAAINLNMILFDWGLRKGTIGQAKAVKRNAKLALKLQTKQIALEVEQAHLAIITARNAVTSLKDKLKFSRANFDAVSLQSDLGQADILDVMDANTTLNNAERELSEAEFYLVLEKIGLQRAKGIFLKSVMDRFLHINQGAEDVNAKGSLKNK